MKKFISFLLMFAILVFPFQNIILSADYLTTPSSSNTTISNDLRIALDQNKPRILQWYFQKDKSRVKGNPGVQIRTKLNKKADVHILNKPLHRFFRLGAVSKKMIGSLFIGSIIIVIASVILYAYVNTPKHVESSSVKTPILPNQFNINERMIAFCDVFDIKTTEERHGTIREKIIAIRKIFTYGNNDNEIVARATREIVSWGVKIHVKDAQDRLIGSIQEKVFKSLLKVHTQYEILDANGNLIAISKKSEILRPKIVVSDLEGNKVVTLTRNYFNFFRDKWSVEVHNTGVIDQRVLVMIAAYKTSVDNDRRAEEKRKKESKNKSSSKSLGPDFISEGLAAGMLAISY